MYSTFIITLAGVQDSVTVSRLYDNSSSGSTPQQPPVSSLVFAGQSTLDRSLVPSSYGLTPVPSVIPGTRRDTLNEQFGRLSVASWAAGPGLGDEKLGEKGEKAINPSRTI